MEIYWYIIVIAFIVVKVLFYVCWYRSRQRQLHAFLHDPDHARILIIGGRPYAQPGNQRHASRVWYNWYSAREDVSPGSPSRSLTPAPSYSQLEPPPPPYDAIVRQHGSGELKPPPYSECVAALLPAAATATARIAGEPEASPPPHAADADGDDYTDSPPPPYSAHGDSSAGTAVAATATADPIDATDGANAALVSTNATAINAAPSHSCTADTNATPASSTPTTPTAVASNLNSATADGGGARPSHGDDDRHLREEGPAAAAARHATGPRLLLLLAGEQPL